MNHEARKIRLGRLTAQVRQERLNYLVKPISSTDPKQAHKRAELEEKIAQWAKSAEAIRRDLEANLRLRSVSAPDATMGKEGYRARRGRQEKQEKAVRDAWYAPYAEFSEEIAALTSEILEPDDPVRTILKGLQKGLKKISESAEAGNAPSAHELIQITQQGTQISKAIDSATPMPPQSGGPVSPLGVLMIAVSLLAALRKNSQIKGSNGLRV